MEKARELFSTPWLFRPRMQGLWASDKCTDFGSSLELE